MSRQDVPGGEVDREERQRDACIAVGCLGTVGRLRTKVEGVG